jgi:hypothetical protein
MVFLFSMTDGNKDYLAQQAPVLEHMARAIYEAKFRGNL